MLRRFQVDSKGTQPYTYMYPFSPRLPSKLPHNKEQSFLRCTVGPCWFSILNIAVCTCPSPLPNCPSPPGSLLGCRSHEGFSGNGLSQRQHPPIRLFACPVLVFPTHFPVAEATKCAGTEGTLASGSCQLLCENRALSVRHR